MSVLLHWKVLSLSLGSTGVWGQEAAHLPTPGLPFWWEGPGIQRREGGGSSSPHSRIQRKTLERHFE